MSLPSFPNSDQVPSREDVINQIISSIAMEELGLSHIINAEGEKLQYALGTIPGISGSSEPLTMEELLELNESVHKTLDSAMMNQFFLKEKLQSALSASVLRGPTGPQGPQGPATIGVDTTVIALEPEEPPAVENVGPSDQNVILQFGIPRGSTGATPTVEVGTTETIEPGLSATVTATPIDTGVELSFQIPRGATGTVEASEMQAALENSAGTEVEITLNGVIPFNRVLSSSGSDISYNMGTSTFTINTTGLYNIYMINWWVFIEGSDSADSVTFSLNVGDISYITSLPWIETRLLGSTLIVAGEDPLQVTLTNVGASPVTLSNISVQAQISIIGFRRTS